MKTKSNSRDDTRCDDPLVLSGRDAHIIASQLKALAHPVRLKILQYLGNQDNCCCNDLCASIPLAQSTISQHLKILSKAGIINYRPVGNCSNYSLNSEVLEEVIEVLSTIRMLASSTGSSDLINQTQQILKD
jgi:ArsR family transcriptional regulator